MTRTLRIVDLKDFHSPDEKARTSFAAELGAGLRELGFVSVKGAGLREGLIDETYAQVRGFFALPLSLIHISEPTRPY